VRMYRPIRGWRPEKNENPRPGWRHGRSCVSPAAQTSVGPWPGLRSVNRGVSSAAGRHRAGSGWNLESATPPTSFFAPVKIRREKLDRENRLTPQPPPPADRGCSLRAPMNGRVRHGGLARAALPAKRPPSPRGSRSGRLVPHDGALHEGHLTSLIPLRARSECDRWSCPLFVIRPAQFNERFRPSSATPAREQDYAGRAPRPPPGADRAVFRPGAVERSTRGFATAVERSSGLTDSLRGGPRGSQHLPRP